MTMQIARAVADAVGFDLSQAVEAFAQALSLHASSEGVPAPVAHPLVEAIIIGGGDFEIIEPPPPPPPPISAISDRQFAQGLWQAGVISLHEAKAFVKIGALPAALQALIDAMPESVRDAADLLISGATSFERGHPVTAQLAAAFGWSPIETDDFWRTCATL